METSRIVATTVETAFGENPNWMAMIATSKEKTVEVVFETAQAPTIAAAIIASSQDAAKRMKPGVLAHELVWNFDNSINVIPDAVDISLASGGDVLCINVGSGILFFRLGEPAKLALGELFDQP